MPWRKYQARKGTHGPIYHVARGIQVRLDYRKLWTLFIENQNGRKNTTFGSGRPALVAAIKAAEELVAPVKHRAQLLLPDPIPAIVPGPLPATDSPGLEQDPLPCFKQLADQWFENGKVRWSINTQERYETLLRLYIKPEPLFNCTVDEIKRVQVRNFLIKVSKTMSPATVETLHTVISSVFNEAILEELINANPASALLKDILPPLKRRDQKSADPFTAEELSHFMNYAQKLATSAQLLVLKLMAYAGLRLGEALAARRENFYPDRRSYFVRESFNRVFRKTKFEKPRLVDLTDFLVTELCDFIEELKRDGLSSGRGPVVDMLFADPQLGYASPFSQRKIQGLVKKICKAAGFRVRNPHDLRHTYATLLLMSHMSPGYVQKQLGHSSISITMDIYCHWISTQGRQGLEEAFGEQSVVPNRVRPPHILAYKAKRSQ